MLHLRYLSEDHQVIAFPTDQISPARHHFTNSVVLDLQTEAQRISEQARTGDTAGFLQSCIEMQMRTPQIMASLAQNYFLCMAGIMGDVARRVTPDFTYEN